MSSDGSLVYVSESSDCAIHVHDGADGHYIRQWGGAGTALGQFEREVILYSCMAPATGELWVCGGLKRIQVFDVSSGSVLRQYTGLTGELAASIGDVAGVGLKGKLCAIRCALSPDGRYLYLMRLRELRVLCADLSLSCAPLLHIVRVIGERGAGATARVQRLQHPRGFCASQDGASVLVADEITRNVLAIHIADDSIAPLVGQTKPNPPWQARRAELFLKPTDVCQSPSGLFLYVSDQYKHTVQCFGRSTPTEAFSYCGDLLSMAAAANAAAEDGDGGEEEEKGKGKRKAQRAQKAQKGVQDSSSTDSGAPHSPTALGFCAATNRLYVCDKRTHTVLVYRVRN